jgi:hypothetical protein
MKRGRRKAIEEEEERRKAMSISFTSFTRHNTPKQRMSVEKTPAAIRLLSDLRQITNDPLEVK